MKLSDLIRDTEARTGEPVVTVGEMYLGLFNNIEDARKARKAAEEEMGFDPLHGEDEAARATR